jgi:hypothetical protein
VIPDHLEIGLAGEGLAAAGPEADALERGRLERRVTHDDADLDAAAEVGIDGERGRVVSPPP